ncbi:YifB family Mg chelatase-like AAA ATPase [Actinopolymorpha rutila]|uniref:Magnesium chelatase family protein n=1 Tax=Actinopolymorpha rutila TaxID=446787 RepID=A0A852ZB14_9ACTN|nr:YifB family Mg chelatase-like AAA ATPase [Actinopolymorpha rutila]NYH89395.1 magnesium chelatase family protein [Actinopolymorpha rutila]
MTLARARSVSLSGVEGHVVDVEAHIGNGLPGFSLVGLPDAALAEARSRVRAAVANSGQGWPQRKLTVALSPATLPKAGAHFDLAIAMAVLGAAQAVSQDRLDDVVLLGELGLDGRLKPIRGTLPSVLAAATAGRTRFVVPEPNVDEARLVAEVEVFGVRSLRQTLALLCGDELPDEPPYPAEDDPAAAEHSVLPRSDRLAGLDLGEVLGQAGARKAVEVAAAGGHHLAMSGPPGAGKTMLAERMPALLPDLDQREALEVTAIHSVAGLLPSHAPLVVRPPFCDPHHSASLPAIVGGGARMARPGAVSLAHRGVLFLDEAPEFRPTVLDALRQPLEHGEVVIARAAGTARFPARFQLVIASNPCPCGRAYGKGLYCTCTPQARSRYQHRLSGPIKDRIDIMQLVEPVARAEMVADQSLVEPSAVVAERVRAARQRQTQRFADAPWTLNAHVPGYELRRRWPPEPDALPAVESQLSSGWITARGADRVLRLAWTLADLAGRDRPGRQDVFAALTLRLGREPFRRDTGRRGVARRTNLIRGGGETQPESTEPVT